MSTARQVAEAAQGWLPAAVHQALKAAERSCTRGQGPAKVCQALPLERLLELPGEVAPWSPLGPLSPRTFLVNGSWFLTREIELSTARAVHVECTETSVKWLLPSDKTDSLAVGKERTLGCSCGSAPPAVCPAHCFMEHLHRLRCLFPEKVLADGKFDPSLPLFPDANGGAISKKAAVDTIEQAAVKLGLPLTRADGVRLFTGHALRPTGAQAMGRAGLDPWLIGLWGRWGSATVMGYLRDAPLAVSSGFAGRTLSSLIGFHRNTAPASASASPDTGRKHAEEALMTGAALKHTKLKLSQLEGRLAQLPDNHALRAMVAELKKESEQATKESLRLLRDAADQGLQEATSSLEGLAQEAGTAAAQAWLTAQAVELRLEAVRATPDGRVHAILVGDLQRPRTEWRTWCGWAFGGSATATRCHLPLTDPKQICRRCLPEARARAERRLMEESTAAS